MGIREDIKMDKNTLGKEVLDVHIFKLLNFFKKYEDNNVREPICIVRNEGFRVT